MFLFFQTLEKDADCVIFLFSFVDRGSFEEISQHITRMAKPKTNFAKLVIGTKYLLSFKIPRDTCYSFKVALGVSPGFFSFEVEYLIIIIMLKLNNFLK